jgi:LPS sulfotransferase NodH
MTLSCRSEKALRYSLHTLRTPPEREALALTLMPTLTPVCPCNDEHSWNKGWESASKGVAKMVWWKGTTNVLIFLAGYLTCHVSTTFVSLFTTSTNLYEYNIRCTTSTMPVETSAGINETTMSAENRTIPKKGIILTSQCSGSTWLVSSLNKRPDVTWKDEELIKYSLNDTLLETVSWDEYQSNLESALSADNGETMVGFKLMYDQIPQHLYAEFANYLDEKQVHVIHLRRRCVALQFASQMQKALRREKIGKSADHFTSKEMVDALPSVPKIPLQRDQGLRRIKNLERNQVIFARYLRTTRAAVFEVAYEDLDGLYGAKWFNGLLGFLGLVGEISQESDMIKVGSRLCEDRINGLGNNDYENLTGLMSRVECYKLRVEGNKESASALFLPPRKDQCLRAPRNEVCPSQLKVAKKVKKVRKVMRVHQKNISA